MTIVEISPLENGAHRNQTISVPIDIPEGWAVVSDTLFPIENFPFGNLTIQEIDGVPTVTGWISNPIPESDQEQEPEPTDEAQFRADLDYLAARIGVEL